MKQLNDFLNIDDKTRPRMVTKYYIISEKNNNEEVEIAEQLVPHFKNVIKKSEIEKDWRGNPKYHPISKFRQFVEYVNTNFWSIINTDPELEDIFVEHKAEYLRLKQFCKDAGISINEFPRLTKSYRNQSQTFQIKKRKWLTYLWNYIGTYDYDRDVKRESIAIDPEIIQYIDKHV